MKLKDVLKGELQNNELEILRGAFDVVGDIAILEIPDELIPREKLIAESLLKVNKNIKVVVKKLGGHEGVFRIQGYKYLAGEERFETVHKENGIKIKLDISKVYFSVRLATERLRIAKLCQEGERVLVMFSGCAPYPIVISKNSLVKEIIGVEINPEGHRYGLENIKLNKVKNVTLYCGDAKDIDLGKFDRVVMPWPKGGDAYLEIAKKAVKKGGFVHFYDFLEESEFNLAEEKVKKIFKKYEILGFVKCGQLSPRAYRVCLDFKAI